MRYSRLHQNHYTIRCTFCSTDSCSYSTIYPWISTKHQGLKLLHKRYIERRGQSLTVMSKLLWCLPFYGTFREADEWSSILSYSMKRRSKPESRKHESEGESGGECENHGHSFHKALHQGLPVYTQVRNTPVVSPNALVQTARPCYRITSRKYTYFQYYKAMLQSSNFPSQCSYSIHIMRHAT